MKTITLAGILALMATAALAQEVKSDRTITLSAPNIQCPNCKKALETALKTVKGVTEVTVDPKAKTIVVTYDHHVTSAARLAGHAAAVKPLHAKTYESALLLTADALKPEDPDKLVAALKGFKSPLDTEPVANVAVDVDKKQIAVTFKPVKLEDPKDRGTDVNPLVNAAKKIVPTVKAVAPSKPEPGK